MKNTHNDKLRQKLVLYSSIQTIIRFFIPVFDASVDNVIFICCKKDQRENNNIVKYINIIDNFHNIGNKQISGSYNQNLAVSPNYAITLDADIDNSILSKMDNNYRLKDFAKSYFGIQTFDRKSFVSKVKVDNNYVPIIDGTNVNPYYLSPYSEYLKFIPTAIKSGGNPNVYLRDRIVVRQIGFFPQGSICPSGLYTLNTIYNLYLWNNKLSLEYLLGLINSKLLHYYWTINYSDSKKTFPKIKKEPLDSLPIVFPSCRKQVDNIVSLVKHILNDKKLNSNTDTINYEQEIDFLVYKLYGLTYDEVKIVDPETPIIKEEYER